MLLIEQVIPPSCWSWREQLESRHVPSYTGLDVCEAETETHSKKTTGVVSLRKQTATLCVGGTAPCTFSSPHQPLLVCYGDISK